MILHLFIRGIIETCSVLIFLVISLTGFGVRVFLAPWNEWQSSACSGSDFRDLIKFPPFCCLLEFTSETIRTWFFFGWEGRLLNSDALYLINVEIFRYLECKFPSVRYQLKYISTALAFSGRAWKQRKGDGWRQRALWPQC